MKYQDHHLILTRGAAFKGCLNFEGVARINGSFQGEIAGPGTLIIEPEGRVEAEVRVQEVVVKGWMKGAIKSSQVVSLMKNSEFYGTIQALKLHIESGACFVGESLTPPLLPQTSS